MSVSELVLFISTNSKSCIPCLRFIQENRVPVQIVRLDTTQARTLAAKGRYFQITSVPSMVSIYEDGNTQIFLGAHKIIAWLKAKIQASYEEEIPESANNMYGHVEKQPSAIMQPIIDEGEDLEEIQEYEYIEEEEPVKAKPKKSKSQKTPKKESSKSSSKKKKPVKAKMNDIYNKAKQMEKDMQGTLGYVEEEEDF